MTSKYLLFALFHFSVSYGSTRTFSSRRSHTCDWIHVDGGDVAYVDEATPSGHCKYDRENTTYGLDLSQDWTTLALTWSKPRGRQIQLHLIVNRCGMTARTTLSPALVALGILSHPLQQAIRLHLNLFGDSARMVKRWCLAWSSWSGLYYTISKWHSPFSRWSVRKRLEGTQRGRSEKTNVF